MNNKLTSALPYWLPIIDIRTGLGGSMEYSPDFSGVPAYSLNLTMSGSRSVDRRNLLNNFPNAPAIGHHCHHTYSYNYNPATGNASADMQLVAARTHIATYPHAGAVRQWNTSGNHQHSYRSIMEEAVTSPVKYNKEDLVKFESKFNTKIPAEIVDIYLKQAPVTGAFRINGNGETVHIAELLVLFEFPEEKDIPDVGYVIETLKANGISIYSRDSNSEPIPYAVDDCGNIFYYSFDNNDNVHYWFYDHEYDEYFEIEQ